ncbi:hypothetical protein R1sor_027040 [Riccia sorocarpa]|uniref:Protein kinase domain-containing protein n=1 Tax=Riccia sorocarpa TaxID=122646 RepID=A0ABD3GFZ5_9MARC
MECQAIGQRASIPVSAARGGILPSVKYTTQFSVTGGVRPSITGKCHSGIALRRGKLTDSALSNFCSFTGTGLRRLYNPKSCGPGRREISRRNCSRPSCFLQSEDFGSTLEACRKLLSELSSQGLDLIHEGTTSVSVSPALERLGVSAAKIVEGLGNLTTELSSQLGDYTAGAHFDRSALAAVEQTGAQLAAAIATYYNDLGISTSPATTATLAVAAGSAVALVSKKDRKLFVEGEDIPLKYDPAAITAYFKKRPLEVLARAVKIISECSALVFNILLDIKLEKYDENEKLRASQLVDLISRLGPTAIKIGQALSIRPDLVSIAYLEELQKLQDRVPPFPNEDARAIILQGLGRPVEEIFSEMSEAPVAAASLGQVYKARLRETGKVIAVKVQRPGVLQGISLDLYLLRAGARVFQRFPGVQSDLIGLLDNWAVRFYDELDYIQEGQNQIQFAKNMKSLPKVTVPAVYTDYNSRKVLTTEWVDGEKLSESKADDLLPLVSTALNCYLTQLLESGFLHADPHPGNLLRTPDGRLCVLDFGLMTQVTEDQRYSLVEYISHLVYSDYERVAEDLVRLGFVPPELEDPQKTAAIVPQLSKVLGQLVQGGGAKKINIQEVTDDLVAMTKEFVFVLPPYFALILRAFSVLEGIGLEADPDYTIVDECYPYISKRLLTDDSPRARAALKYFLYGGKGQLDVSRVEEMVRGFQSFRESMGVAGPIEGPGRTGGTLDSSTKEALKMVFAPEGSYVQELLLIELARSVDALSREALAELWRLIASTLRIPGLPVPASLLMPGSWPLPVPGFLFGVTTVATLSEEDRRSLDTVKRLWALTEPSLTRRAPLDILADARDSLPFFLDLLPGVATAAQRFILILLQRQALRFADDLDGTSSVDAWNKDAMAAARGIQPLRSFFSFLPRDRVD